jgi:hypothetical protein
MEMIELDGRKWLTAPDAAELACVQTVTIYQNIARGRLTSRQIMGRIAVPKDEVLVLWPQPEPEPVE